jgi:hypothetical protein
VPLENSIGAPVSSIVAWRKEPGPGGDALS